MICLLNMSFMLQNTLTCHMWLQKTARDVPGTAQLPPAGSPPAVHLLESQRPVAALARHLHNEIRQGVFAFEGLHLCHGLHGTHDVLIRRRFLDDHI